jgi:hypothetical protein
VERFGFGYLREVPVLIAEQYKHVNCEGSS